MTNRTATERAADIAESMGYFAVARAIRADGDENALAQLMRDRLRKVTCPTPEMAKALGAVVAERMRHDPVPSGAYADSVYWSALYTVWGAVDNDANPIERRKNLASVAAIAIAWIEHLENAR